MSNGEGSSNERVWTICSSKKRGVRKLGRRGDLRRAEKGSRLQEVPHAGKWNAFEPASHHRTLSRVDLVAEVGIFGETINSRAEHPGSRLEHPQPSQFVVIYN